MPPSSAQRREPAAACSPYGERRKARNRNTIPPMGVGVKKRATPSTVRITEAIVSRTAQISNRNTSRGNTVSVVEEKAPFQPPLFAHTWHFSLLSAVSAGVSGSVGKNVYHLGIIFGDFSALCAPFQKPWAVLRIGCRAYPCFVRVSFWRFFNVHVRAFFSLSFVPCVKFGRKIAFHDICKRRYSSFLLPVFVVVMGVFSLIRASISACRAL